MWSYYGAKTNVVNYYPKPKFGKIIEPFAGTARYALKYFDRDVLLVDKYEVIVKIWKWLQQCSENDILKLPRLKQGENINEIGFDCDEAKMLMSFLIGFSTPTPRNIVTRRVTDRPNWLNYSLNRIAKNLFKIKHWQIECDTFENIENEKATWFVDPPYKRKGDSYKHGSEKIDFGFLAQYCKSREGQVIVCESLDASWLDFKLLISQKVRTGMQSEGIWTNEPSVYDNVQLQIF